MHGIVVRTCLLGCVIREPDQECLPFNTLFSFALFIVFSVIRIYILYINIRVHIQGLLLGGMSCHAVRPVLKRGLLISFVLKLAM